MRSCRRCGGLRRYPSDGRCIDCQNRRERRQRVEALNFPVTPAMRAYLAAFDAWLHADGLERRRLAKVRQRALDCLEDA